MAQHGSTYDSTCNFVVASPGLQLTPGTLADEQRPSLKSQVRLVVLKGVPWPAQKCALQ